MYYYVVISTKLLSFLKNKIKKIKNIQQKMPDSLAAIHVATAVTLILKFYQGIGY